MGSFNKTYTYPQTDTGNPFEIADGVRKARRCAPSASRPDTRTRTCTHARRIAVANCRPPMLICSNMLATSGFNRPACTPGRYLSQKCTFDAAGKATQGECKECSRMSFSVGGLQDKCQTFTECNDDEYEVAAPSPSSDRRCKACSKQCARDEYATSACSSTANLQCKSCTMDPGAGNGGWFLEASCGGNADATWATCKECSIKVKTECTLKSDTVCGNCPDDATSIVRSVSKNE